MVSSLSSVCSRIFSSCAEIFVSEGGCVGAGVSAGVCAGVVGVGDITGTGVGWVGGCDQGKIKSTARRIAAATMPMMSGLFLLISTIN